METRRDDSEKNKKEISRGSSTDLRELFPFIRVHFRPILLLYSSVS